MPASVPLTVLVICLGGLTQGVTGFGFGLVLMPLLPLLMPVQQAAVLTALLNVVVCVMTFLSARSGFSMNHGRALILGSCLGVPIGVFVLSRCSQTLLLTGLGVVMIMFAVNELVLGRRKHAISQSWGLPLGVLSGGLSGAFNMGGPPAVAYAYSQPWTREQTVAVLQLVFGLTTIVRVGMLAATDLIDSNTLILAAWAFIPLGITIFVGARLFSGIPHVHLRRAIFIFLGVMGAKYVFF